MAAKQVTFTGTPIDITKNLPPYTTTLKIHKHCLEISESLAIAFQFLSGFKDAGWPNPTEVVPRIRGDRSARTSQMDVDIVVARHLSMAATLTALVALDGFPRGGAEWNDVLPATQAEEERLMELFAEVEVLATEASDISEYFARYHDLKGEEAQAAEMKELRALYEWYDEVLQPLLQELVGALEDLLDDGGDQVVDPVWEAGEARRRERERHRRPSLSRHGAVKLKYHPISFRARLERSDSQAKAKERAKR